MSRSLNVASVSPGDGKTSIIAALAHRWREMGKTVETGSAQAEADADIVLVEGGDGDPTETSVLVVGFSRDLNTDSVKSAAESLGDGLIGVIVNRVPTLGARVAEQDLKPAIEAAGLRVLGLVPEGRVLFGITVDDLVARLEGRYALEGEGRDELVEHVMVGANLLDAEDFPAGPEYFGQRDKKAVIAKGDRPDFQWAAMNTPTRCLILTGDFEPIPYVLERAKELQVPIAVVEKDTLDTLDAIEDILSGPGLDGEAKLREFTALVESSIDTVALDQALGLGQVHYWVNVDKAFGTATLHRADSKDDRCQPREKKAANGYWQSFYSIDGALAFIDDIVQRLHPCGVCNPAVKTE